MQLWRIVHGNVVDSRMAGLGNEVPVIEAAQERMVADRQLVFVDTEELCWQKNLFDAIEMIERGLGTPAER